VAAGAIAAVPAQGTTQPPRPTVITATASTDNAGLGGAVPQVLVEAGDPVDLTVTLQPAGAAYKFNTPLTLSASLESGDPTHGTLSPTTVVMPAGANTATFSVTYSAVDNGVQITVTQPPDSSGTATPGTTAPFDVLKELTTFAANDPRLTTGLGIGNNGCTAASTEPACATLVLNKGTASSRGALSIGACTADLGCRTGSQVVQVVADLGNLYPQTAPGLLIYRCDKQLCKGKGIRNYPLKISFNASGPLDLTTMRCLKKGVAKDAYGNNFCLDLVQSHRDNSGDALLYLLFTHDMRGST
jgi:hypothetical protein